jgi:hypothetical protein
MPIILATQEAEIRRTAVQRQPRQTVHGTLSQKYPTQNRAGGMGSMSIILATQEAEIRKITY